MKNCNLTTQYIFALKSAKALDFQALHLKNSQSFTSVWLFLYRKVVDFY